MRTFRSKTFESKTPEPFDAGGISLLFERFAEQCSESESIGNKVSNILSPLFVAFYSALLINLLPLISFLNVFDLLRLRTLTFKLKILALVIAIC